MRGHANTEPKAPPKQHSTLPVEHLHVAIILLRFNQVEYIPVELQTGGSVDGLDECYMNEGSA